MTMKRPLEGMAQMEQTLRLDPLNEMIQVHYGAALELAGRYDEAALYWRKFIRTSPENPASHWMLAGLLFRKGSYEESLAEMKGYFARDTEVQRALVRGYAQSGFRGAMRRAAETLAARNRATHVSAADVAGLFAMAGENDQALTWLERGVEMRDGNMPYIDHVPELEGLRSTPRFQAQLRHMNLPQ